MYKNLKIYLLLLVTCYLLLVTAPTAQAQTMSNKDYIIKTERFNAVSGTTTGNDYVLRSTMGELNPFTSEGVNFKVKAGFENAESALPFSVTLSSDLVDFGILNPTNPIIRTVDLSVYSLGIYGYSVIASENHPLQKIDAPEDLIPDTTCDNGTCNEKSASEWTNALTYGFGYLCDNVTSKTCSDSFSKPNFYKHFPDSSKSEHFQSVMDGIGAKNRDVRLSYKINISGSQPEGIYSNVITFIAIPNF